MQERLETGVPEYLSFSEINSKRLTPSSCCVPSAKKASLIVMSYSKSPTALFASVQEAPLTVFQRDAPSIHCEVDGKLAAVIAIDRSDAKITVKRIQLSACTVHAEWHTT